MKKAILLRVKSIKNLKNPNSYILEKTLALLVFVISVVMR